MTFDFIDEPELEFGAGGRHIDIRFGIMDNGPADVEAARAPKAITVGIIGTPANVEGLRLWLEKCRGLIPAKESRQPNLFPYFPGFSRDTAFRSELVLDSAFDREIPQRDIERISRMGDHNTVVNIAVERFRVPNNTGSAGYKWLWQHHLYPTSCGRRLSRSCRPSPRSPRAGGRELRTERSLLGFCSCSGPASPGSTCRRRWGVGPA